MASKTGVPAFRREAIWVGPPAERTSCVVGDLDGDGVPEIVIGQRGPTVEVTVLDRGPDGRWRCSPMDNTLVRTEAGGDIGDLTGNGCNDLVMGCDYKGNEVYWWENPGEASVPWTAWKRRVVCRMPANQTHDQMIADVDGDGKNEVYFWNQGSRTLFCATAPTDPRVEPWPVHSVAGGLREEGLCVADVDGDGKVELIAGLSWYRPLGKGCWERHEFARGYVSPKSVVADFDGDGRPEIVISEGDASLNGREYGRVVLFKAGRDVEGLWEATVLHERLLEPHSLQAADFDGDGRPDLFVGEMGLPKGDNPHPPAQRIYFNRGGRLEEQIIDEGVGTHEAKVIEIDGKVGIAGKPFRVLSATNRDGETDCVHLWLPA